MRVSSIQNYLNLNPKQLADTFITCPYCGRDHNIPYKEIHHGSGVLQEIPGILTRCMGHEPECVGVIFDKHIEDIIVSSIIEPLTSKIKNLKLIPLGARHHHLEPFDHIGKAAASMIDPSVDILLGAGSGVICDLTKYISEITGLPHIICATAVSMNAYTSNTAVITENNFKISRLSRVSYAVVMDTTILSSAPVEMTLAGMGDLTARSICNADFLLSHLLKQTNFCPLPFLLTSPYEQRYLAAAADIGLSQPSAIDILSEADLVSGYSMTILDGETFPSSGAEHVLSHFWDLQSEIFDSPKNLHGTQVTIGTLINLAMYAFLRKFQPSQINITKLIRSRPSIDQLKRENRTRFGQAGNYLNQVMAKKWLTDEELRIHLTSLQRNWDNLWQHLDPYVTSPGIIRSALQSAGAPTSIAAIQRSKEQVLEAIVFGNRYRVRYTILDLLNELGLLPDIAPDLLDLSGVIS